MQRELTEMAQSILHVREKQPYLRNIGVKIAQSVTESVDILQAREKMAFHNQNQNTLQPKE